MLGSKIGRRICRTASCAATAGREPPMLNGRTASFERATDRGLIPPSDPRANCQMQASHRSSAAELHDDVPSIAFTSSDGYKQSKPSQPHTLTLSSSTTTPNVADRNSPLAPTPRPLALHAIVRRCNRHGRTELHVTTWPGSSLDRLPRRTCSKTELAPAPTARSQRHSSYAARPGLGTPPGDPRAICADPGNGTKLLKR